MCFTSLLVLEASAHEYSTGLLFQQEAQPSCAPSLMNFPVSDSGTWQCTVGEELQTINHRRPWRAEWVASGSTAHRVLELLLLRPHDVLEDCDGVRVAEALEGRRRYVLQALHGALVHHAGDEPQVLPAGPLHVHIHTRAQGLRVLHRATEWWTTHNRNNNWLLPTGR